MKKTVKKMATVVVLAVMVLAIVAVGSPAIVKADGGTTVVPVPVSTFGSNLGTLFTLGRLFNCDPVLGCSTGTSIGDLFILGQLFGGSINTPGFGYQLGNLFTLNALFDSPSLSSGLLTPGGATLGNLFILDQLFQ